MASTETRPTSCVGLPAGCRRRLDRTRAMQSSIAERADGRPDNDADAARWGGPAVLRPRQQEKLARGAKPEQHAMSAKANSAIAVIGIDIGKNSFHVVGQDKRGAIMLRQKWLRGQAEARLANLPPCLIGMEAWVGAHHLSRKLRMLGHDARLMPAKLRLKRRASRRRRVAARLREHDHRHCWLLRPRRERPRGSRAAEQRDELAALHGCPLLRLRAGHYHTVA
jgi:hypothetical protein